MYAYVVIISSREDAHKLIQYGCVGALSQVPGGSRGKGADGNGSGASGALESLFTSMSKIYLPTFVANETWPESTSYSSVFTQTAAPYTVYPTYFVRGCFCPVVSNHVRLLLVPLFRTRNKPGLQGDQSRSMRCLVAWFL